MFSRVFPAHHPKKGQHTNFCEKVVCSLLDFKQGTQKHHTIRAGNRLKAGEVVSARYWEGLPYRSKQIEFAEIEILKTYDFEMKEESILSDYAIFIDGKLVDNLRYLAQNDGLTLGEFLAWFKYPCNFKGQIICWSNKVNY